MKRYIQASSNDYKQYMIEYNGSGKVSRVFAQDEQEIKRLYDKYKSEGYSFRVFKIDYVGSINDDGDVVLED